MQIGKRDGEREHVSTNTSNDKAPGRAREKPTDTGEREREDQGERKRVWERKE